MHAEMPLLKDIVIVFSLSLAVLLVASRFRIPSLVGFLVVGMLAGPHGLKLMQSIEEVRMLAEIGVVLLLFTIGLEFSFKNLIQIGRSVLLGGGLQVALTLGSIVFLASFFFERPGTAVLLGMLGALSSTAIVLKLLQERGETDAPHGRLAFGILIFQDLVMVPFMLLIPFLAGQGAAFGSGNMAITGAKVVGVIVLVVVGTKWVIPHLLFRITKTRSRELFLISVVTFCFMVAILFDSLGISLALGAFLAGLMISESEYSHQATGDIIPLRDLFLSFFFISIGMLLDIGYVAAHVPLILGVTVGLFALKFLALFLTGMVLGYPVRVLVRTAFTLSQVGEFAFVLAAVGRTTGLLENDIYQLFLAVSILTMAATPLGFLVGGPVAERLARLPGLRRLNLGMSDKHRKLEEAPHGHVVVVGLGLNGRNLVKALKSFVIPYVIIEMNPETVRRERARGEPILFGDAGNEPVLEEARIRDARAVAVAVPAPTAARQIVFAAKRMKPSLFVIVRARFVTETAPLMDLGADIVVAEEYETSIEIAGRVLNRFLVPRNEILAFVKTARRDGYEMFRSLSVKPNQLSDLSGAARDLEVMALRVEGHSAMVGKSLREMDFRKRYGATVLAVQRGETLLDNPSPDEPLKEADTLIVLQKNEHCQRLGDLFQACSDSPT